MLQPKRQKYRKQFRRAATVMKSRGTSLAFGEFGMKSEGRAWLSAVQLESARRSLAFYTRRGGKVWVRVFPDKPVTKKAAGARMGSGKGDIFGYVAVITPGRILFEMGGIPKDIATEAMRRAGHKLPVKTKLVIKE